MPYWGMRTKSKYFTYTATHHSLQVHLRAPIIIIQNHNICCGQVDPQTSCPGAQHENKLFTSRHVICIDCWLSLLMRCLSIQTAVLKSFPQTVIFKDVQHSGHLRENQNSGTFQLKPHKQLLGVKESINLSTNQSVYIVSQSISLLVD